MLDIVERVETTNQAKTFNPYCSEVKASLPKLLFRGEIYLFEGEFSSRYLGKPTFSFFTGFGGENYHCLGGL